jgi:hypothetical protein
MIPLATLATSAFLLVVTYTLYTIYYRLYLHPLAKYPGPFWARISDLPSFYYTSKQDRHVWLLRLQQQYGKVSTENDCPIISPVRTNTFQKDLSSATAQTR